MDIIEYHGATYISAYLGTSLTSIHNWRSESACDFPRPAASITGISGARAAFGWSSTQLPLIRTWYAKRFKLNEVTAAERWKAIDEDLSGGQDKEHEKQCPGQALLFSVSVQGEAA
jgi:hypothetical protein